MIFFSSALDGRPTVFNCYCSIKHTVAAAVMDFFFFEFECTVLHAIQYIRKPRVHYLINMSRNVKMIRDVHVSYINFLDCRMFNWCCLPSYLSINHDATIRVQALARDEAAVLAGEKDKTCSNFTWLPWTANWHWAKLLHCGGRHCWWDKRGPDWIRLGSARWALFILGWMNWNLLGPGQTQLTRMPLLICWLDKPRVKATIAPFVDV